MAEQCYVVVTYWANADERMNRSSWAGVRSAFRARAAAQWESRPDDNVPTKRRTVVWAVTPTQAAAFLSRDFQRGAQFLAFCDEIGVVVPGWLR